MSENATEGVEGGTEPVSPTAEQGDPLQGNPDPATEAAVGPGPIGEDGLTSDGFAPDAPEVTGQHDAPQPGADEDGFGGDAPQPADAPEGTPQDGTTVAEGETDPVSAAPVEEGSTPDPSEADVVEEAAVGEDKPEWRVETHGEPPAGREHEYDVVR